jgi:DNA-binding MarR family transcriptional regulator
MPPQLSKKKSVDVAKAILDMDQHWSALFGALELSDLNYSDLFIHMWLKREQPLRKTSLYEFMPGISRRTAVKYVQELIDRGLLEEMDAEDDRRVRFISLSAEIETRLDRFLRYSYERFQRLS